MEQEQAIAAYDGGQVKDNEIEAIGVRRQILNAAALLLRLKGYEATTTRAIATEVGIKGGSIYHHFPSKDAIVEAVVNEGVLVVYNAVAKALDSLPKDATPRQRLEAAIKGHLLSSLEHSNYTSASIRAFAFLPQAVRSGCRVERRRYETLWEGLVQELYDAKLIDPSISPDSVRLLLLGALNWAGEWYRPERMDINDISRDFAASIVGTK
ncbi:AcrR family transcriptional regulator [Rhodoligotrophos appendicifer]|uniref:TetR/AcrR family transcriptional regulator n=1 Tax=Rhodoligotrophos appendicifer TaxID=987056 RepID=UPI001186F882|nr:TetR/AcrR family transcriptional regulator [Rhodoligotrophos appendicifer]